MKKDDETGLLLHCPKLEWTTKKLRARTKLAEEEGSLMIWQSDPLTKELYQGSIASLEGGGSVITTLSAFSAAPGKKRSLNKQNKHSRYIVELGKRPPARLLANARMQQFERYIAQNQQQACIKHQQHDTAQTEAEPVTRIGEHRRQARHRKLNATNSVSTTDDIEMPSLISESSAMNHSILSRRITNPSVRRERSDEIAAQMQKNRTERIDVLSRKPFLNPREILSQARQDARDAEVAATVTAAAMAAEELQKRRETVDRRSRLKSSIIGQQLASHKQMAQLLAMRRQHQERDAKRRCAQTLSHWAKCALNDGKLIKEGAVDAAARLALEDDEATRKFSAFALRTLAMRPVFWPLLLRPHVLSTFRELFNEECLPNTLTPLPSQGHHIESHQDDTSNNEVPFPSHLPPVHSVPRDATIALAELTCTIDKPPLLEDGSLWEAHLVDKNLHMLFLHGATRHLGVAEAAAVALYNLTCAATLYPQMDRLTRSLIQLPGVNTSSTIRAFIAKALRNIATHPTVILRMIEEGVVQRIVQLATAPFLDQGLENPLQQLTQDIQKYHHNEDDDIVAEACMRVLFGFAGNPVVRLDMLHGGAARAIFAFLRRPSKNHVLAARIAGWGALTFALLIEAPGALDIIGADHCVDAARAFAIAVNSAVKLGESDKAHDLACPRGASNAAAAIAMVTSTVAGRKLLAVPYKFTKCSDTCAAHDIWTAFLGPQSSILHCRSRNQTHQNDFSSNCQTDSVLHYSLIATAQLLADEVHGTNLLRLAVRSKTLQSVTKLCCRCHVDFPSDLSSSSGLPDFDHSISRQDDTKNSQIEKDFDLESIAKVENSGVVVVPTNLLSQTLVGPIALVYDRVTSFEEVKSDSELAHALVPGIVSLAERIHELTASGWTMPPAALTTSFLNMPAWCLASCSAALGRLASTNEVMGRARVSSADGALPGIVRTLDILHDIPKKDPAVACQYFSAATRALIALRQISLEPGAVTNVASTVATAALVWFRSSHEPARAATASLFAVLSKHEECRSILLDSGLLPVLLSQKFRSSSNKSNDIGLEEEFKLDGTNDKEANVSKEEYCDYISTGQLCCAITLANMSLDTSARFAMVSEKAAKAMSTLSDTSYAEENQLACARALCNLCSTVSEQAERRANFGGELSHMNAAKGVVSALMDQGIIAALSMIGAVRASRDTTRRSCAAGIANLMVPSGYFAYSTNVLKLANDQGLFSTLTRLSNVSDLHTITYTACALARLSESLIGRNLILSRSQCLRVIYGGGAAKWQTFMDRINESALKESVLQSPASQFLRTSFVQDSRSASDIETCVLLYRTLARLACRLVIASAESRSVAIQAGMLRHLIDMLTIPNFQDLQERLPCIIAIEAVARETQFRTLLVSDCRFLSSISTVMSTIHNIVQPSNSMKRMSESVQITLSLLAHDPRTRNAIAEAHDIVCNLVAIAVEQSRNTLIAQKSIVTARTLLCILLTMKDVHKLGAVIKSGVLFALMALETRRRQQSLSDVPDLDETDPEVIAHFELAAIVTSAIRVIVEVSAGSHEMSLKLRDGGVLDLLTDQMSEEKAARLMVPTIKKSSRIQMWSYITFVRATATMYAVARYHETLRTKLDDMIVNSVHIIASNIVPCPTSLKVLTTWTMATLALMMSDVAMRNTLAGRLCEDVVRVARLELKHYDQNGNLLDTPAIQIVKNDALLDESTTQFCAGATVKNLSWCLYQLTRSSKKSARTALQDSIDVISDTAKLALVANHRWLVAASTLATRKLTMQQYDSTVMAQSGTLEMLVQTSFSPTQGRVESEAHALLRDYEDFRALAKALQPSASTFVCTAHDPLEFVSELANILEDRIPDIPDETNEVFLCDTAGAGPKIAQESSRDVIDYDHLTASVDDFNSKLLSNCHNDVLNEDEHAHKARATKRTRRRSSGAVVVDNDRRGDLHPWFRKSGIPRLLLEASNAEEGRLADGEDDDDIIIKEEETNEQSNQDEEDSSDTSDDEDDDYLEDDDIDKKVDFSRTNRRQRDKLLSEKVTVDENWSLPVTRKSPEQLHFLMDELSHVIIFNHLTRKDIRCIADAMKPEHFEAGTKFIDEKVDDTFYILDTGAVKLYRGGKFDREISWPLPDEVINNNVVDKQRPKLHMSEESLLYQHSHLCAISAKAHTDIDVWSLDRKTFKMIMQSTESKTRKLYASFIDNVPLFKNMDLEQKHMIASALQRVDYSKGEILIRQGEIGHDFFIIEEGTVECIQESEGAQIVLCPELKPGAFFGELALLRNAPRSATVRALENVTVVRIDKITFDRTIGDLDGVHKDYTDIAGASEEPSSQQQQQQQLQQQQQQQRRKQRLQKQRRKSMMHRSNSTLSSSVSISMDSAAKSAEYCEDTDDDESSEDDDEDYDNFQLKARHGRKHRTIHTETIFVTHTWTPPKFEKNASEAKFLSENLKNLFYLQTMSDREIDALVNAMQLVEFEQGKTLFRQNDRADELFIIQDGYCRVIINGVGMVRDIPDDQGAALSGGPVIRHVGEMALLHDKRRGATVFALSQVRAWKLDRRTFKSIMQDTSNKQRIAYTNFISKVPLFQGLNQAQIHLVADSLKSEKYEAGDILVREDEPRQDFYILEEGQLQLTRTINGVQVPVSRAHLERGAYFGELALLKDAPKSMNVKALGKVSVLKIDRDTFHRVIGELDEIDQASFKPKAHDMNIQNNKNRRISLLDIVHRFKEQQKQSTNDTHQSSEMNNSPMTNLQNTSYFGQDSLATTHDNNNRLVTTMNFRPGSVLKKEFCLRSQAHRALLLKLSDPDRHRRIGRISTPEPTNTSQHTR